ncbi:MAG: guanylate kinase [Gemmatimonadota bacterium]
MSSDGGGAAGSEKGSSRELRARGFPLVLAGPSGSGKTTIGRALVERRDDVRFSVSATTRDRRPNEREGIDYHFLARDAFRRRIEADAFLEWAEVHGELYGTLRSELKRARERGEHLLLDIDVQGARSVRDRVRDAVTVFLLAPSGERIVERLRGRGSESEGELRRRLRAAEAELAAVSEFDFVVVNAVLDRAVEALETIVRSEERRIERMPRRVQQRGESLAREIRATLGFGEPESPG